jgi:hypothetical protein
MFFQRTVATVLKQEHVQQMKNDQAGRLMAREVHFFVMENLFNKNHHFSGSLGEHM